MTPTQALAHLEEILTLLARVQPGLHADLDRTALITARFAIGTVVRRLARGPRGGPPRAGGHTRICRRRTFWLCTACKRCRRYTSLHAAFGRFWCASCQAVQVFRPLLPMPQMARYARVVTQEDET